MTRAKGAMVHLRRQLGFTLVETLASLLVFSMVTLGLVPLVLTSIRGSNLSRSHTIGRTVASEAMERLRGLPFYVAYSTQPKRVDVLDFYFPDLGTPGYIPGLATYRVNCSGGGTGACPATLPEGYTLRFESAFVELCVTGDPCYVAGRETYKPVAPAAGYSWDSASNDRPRTELLRANIRVSWPLQGRTRSVTLTTLLSDRPFGGLQARGAANVDYALRVLTGYRAGGDDQDVIAMAGLSDAEVSARRLSDAATSQRAASLRLLDADDPDGLDLATVEGAVGQAAAPPQATPTSSSGAAGTLTSTRFGNVAGIRETNTTNVGASLGSGTPAASGAWSFLNGTSTLLDFWVDNPGASRTGASTYRFANDKLLSVRTTGSATLRGSTSANVNAAGAGVASSASAAFNHLRLLPTSFIASAPCPPAAGGDGDDGDEDCRNSDFGGAVVAVETFTSEANCLARVGGAVATASYTATVHYWVDPDPNDQRNQGRYSSVSLNVSSASSVPDALRALREAWSTTNAVPLVLDGNQTNNNDDVYLFRVSHTNARDGHSHTHEGYLSDWSSRGELAASNLQGGRLVSAQVDDALTFITRPTEPGNVNTAFSVSAGNLGCTAEERR